MEEGAQPVAEASEEKSPVDKKNFMYFIFLLHGIGVLIPWNIFMNQAGFYTTIKFGNNTYYKENFMQYTTFFSQIPNVTFNWMNIFIHIGGEITKRVVWSLGTTIILSVISLIFIQVDTSSWTVAFFWITMIVVFLYNAATGIYQNTIFGISAKFPFKYTAAIILGNNVCGTFVTVVVIICTYASESLQDSATYSFVIVIIVLLVCFDSYFLLPLIKYYRYHYIKQMKEELQNEQNTEKVPYKAVFKKAWPQLLNVFLVFFVTLAIFPVIHMGVQPIVPNQDNFLKKNFNLWTCFLTFNVTAMLGSLLPHFLVWPKPKWVIIPVVLRLLYIPFYIFCNYQSFDPTLERRFGVAFGDVAYWCVAVTFGLTGGYWSSVSMIYVSVTADPKHAGVAGQFGAACLLSGIFGGILIAFAWPAITFRKMS